MVFPDRVEAWADRKLDKAGFTSQSMLGMVMTICWILFSITLVIRMTAGDGGYLAEQMLEHAPPEESRLPESEYPGMGDMIADYLTRKTDEFQYTYTSDSGKLITCFQRHEADHMADVRGLISEDESTAVAAGITALIMFGICFVVERRWRKFFEGMAIGLGIAAGIAIILAMWAAVNFQGLFVTFHRIAFSNDGWRLNPNRDMLIRLMPIDFFISLGIRGALQALIIPAILAAVAGIGLWKTKSRGSK